MNEQFTTMQLATVPLPQQALTMSSREIADITGKRHDNVMRVCRDLKATGVTPQIEELPFQHKGNSYVEFRLGKRDSMVVVARLSPEFTARLVDYWMEREAGEAKPSVLDYSDPRVVLGVLSHLQGEVAKKNEIIQEQGTRLKKLDRLESAKGSMCVSDAAKTLGVGRDWLFQFLSTRKWTFKRAGNKNWLAYDVVRKSGYLEHDDHLYMDDLGRERVSTRVLVTAKGLVKLAELIEQPLH
jgi:phage antirepressor YoqD-like protein